MVGFWRINQKKLKEFPTHCLTVLGVGQHSPTQSHQFIFCHSLLNVSAVFSKDFEGVYYFQNSYYSWRSQISAESNCESFLLSSFDIIFDNILFSWWVDWIISDRSSLIQKYHNHILNHWVHQKFQLNSIHRFIKLKFSMINDEHIIITYFVRNIVCDNCLFFLIFNFPNLWYRLSTLWLLLLHKSETTS